MINSISLFNDLSTNELEHLLQITTEVSFKRGDVIFQQGDATRDFFVVKHGQVEISVKDIFQDKRVVTILKNGEFFGEMSLFEKNSTRSATATAFQNSTMYKIPGPEFERLLVEYPNISIKLLGTMSKRIRDMLTPTRENAAKASIRQGKIITVCSSKDGYGKTTFATTLANILSMELPKKVLFVDLDLYYGDGTFLMGVYSPKSIVDLAIHITSDSLSEEALQKYLSKKSPTLSVLPAPKDMVEGEKLHPEEFVKVINACRKHFDYLILDTHSTMSEHLLNALDMSDQMIFLIDCRDSISIKSNSIFLQALNRLNLPDPHINLMMTRTNQGLSPDNFRKIFKWRINGILPEVKNLKMESTSMPYFTEPNGDFCNVVRTFAREIFNEPALGVTNESGFFSRWFGGAEAAGTTPPVDLALNHNATPASGLGITDENFVPIMKEIRTLISQGFLDRAQEECTKLVSMNARSAPVLEMMGEVFYLKEDYAHAIDVFEKVLELDPDNHLARGYLGYIRSDPKSQEKALQVLTGKIQKHPEFPDLVNHMGRLLLMYGKPAEAIGFFEKALAINPTYSESRVNLALAYGQNGNYDEGIRQLLKVETKTTRVFYLMGNFFYSTGKFFEAISAYTRVSEANPNYYDTDDKIQSLSEYFSKLNNLLEMHKRLAKQSPTYPDLRYKIGNLYLLVGKRQEALAEFTEALRLKPTYEEARKKIEALNKESELGLESFLSAANIDVATSPLAREAALAAVSKAEIIPVEKSVSASS